MNIWLEFKDIDYVSEIARCEKLSVASENLHITQPALSIYVKNLEKRLGVKVFERIGKRFVLTAAGQAIVEDGAEILRLQRGIERKLTDISAFDDGQISIGAPTIRGISLFPPVIREFRKRFPNIKIQIQEEDAQNLYEMVLDGRLNIAFTNAQPENPFLLQIPILEDPVVLYASRDFPLLNQAELKKGFSHSWVDLRRCADYPFILNYPNQRTYSMAMMLFSQMNLSPNISLTVRNQLTAIHLAALGCGLYIAPEYFSYNIAFAAKPQILSIGDEQPLSSSFVAIVHKNCLDNHLVTEFIDIVKKLYSYSGFEQ